MTTEEAMQNYREQYKHMSNTKQWDDWCYMAVVRFSQAVRRFDSWYTARHMARAARQWQK